MSNDIRVIIIRPTILRGAHLEPGSTHKLPALDAHALVSNGKATLQDEADNVTLQAAVSEANHNHVRNSPGYMPQAARW